MIRQVQDPVRRVLDLFDFHRVRLAMIGAGMKWQTQDRAALVYYFPKPSEMREVGLQLLRSALADGGHHSLGGFTAQRHTGGDGRQQLALSFDIETVSVQI